MALTAKLILATPPSQAAEARGNGLPVAPMALRLGDGYRLLSAALPSGPWGGPVVMHLQGAPPPRQLSPDRVQAVVQFCLREGVPGVLADWPEAPPPSLVAFTAALAKALDAAGLTLALPLRWHTVSPTAGLLVPSALSGGTLRGYLTDLGQRFGWARLVLLLQRSCHRFQLPSPNGQGTPLDAAALAQYRRRWNPRVYFSPELCTQYFTWQEGAEPQLALFDDAASLRAKWRLAGELGISTCVAAYPEVSALLPELLGRDRSGTV